VSDRPIWSHHNPVRIVSGPLDALATHVQGEHVLLVTTPGFVKRGVVQRIQAILAPKQVTVWDGVKPNPDLRDLDAASALLRVLGVDCVVGLGGGSALDAAKVIATTLPSSNQLTLSSVFRDGISPLWAKRLPLVAIPTTSGTGAEVTPFATLWDHEQRKKHSLAGEFVFPDIALIDSTLTHSLNYENSLYPALDTISHALESLWNKNITPVSRLFSFRAIELSANYLPDLILNLNNVSARYYLQIASVFAGIAISQTRTAIAHAISYPLTTKMGMPHGLACSFLLDKLIDVNIDKITNNELEKKEIEKIKKVLSNVDFPAHLSRYATSREIEILLSSDGLDNARLQNYSGRKI
jgi:phosphonate metabolism-associated iron-containing alcohol dehydrogenase